MRHYQIPSSRFTAQLLGMICLLLATTGLTFAQSGPTISINDIAVLERDSGLFGRRFTVTLSAPSDEIINVTVSTQPGTATNNADFGAGSQVLEFKKGQTSETIDVFVIGDTLVEGTEQFFVNLSNLTGNATIADGQGMGTIVDDDTLLLLTQEGSQRGLVVDSVFQTLESFAINTGELPFFSSDHRMRISLMAIGLKLAPGENASAVAATAEDTGGTVRPLTVESVNTPPTAEWITQIVVKLNDQITPAQDMKVKITVHGISSNTVLVAVKPQ
ncbi:MAG TPA: Calx-beta domain-containing protein [Pyrinomonadaceae bacterium]|nr:Calx-beta domain-containing protein [Pyrinomonadaceae bacterium]